MAKGNRGGKLSGGGSGGTLTPPNTQQTTPQTAQPIQTAQNTPQSMSADFNNFMAMSDDDKADVIDSMIKQGVPAHLADNDFQRFIYNIGLNDKPDVVDDATLDAMSGLEMFRTVNAVKNTAIGVTYSAPEIAKQIQGGSITRVSDTGGSAYGRGLYFTPDCHHSMSMYGRTNGNVKQTCTIRSKLNSNAKIITDTKVSSGINWEIGHGTKLGKVLSKCDRASRESLYAIAKGYNVILGTGSGSAKYHNVLNRQAMTISKDVHPANSSGKW